MKIHHNITDLIGKTPLVELHHYGKKHHLKSRIIAKLEYLNPAGSIKDRAALNMINEAEKSGKLKKGDTIVDVTSGNTGIALAAVAAAKGYATKFYVSDNISADKIKLLKLYGAEVIAVENAFFMDPEALEKMAARIVSENPNAFFIDQLANPDNPKVHIVSTGPEIWEDTDGQVDILVCAMGTGGTVSGTGKYLKSKNPKIKVVIAEPAETSLPSEENPYPDEIDGVHKVSEVPPESLPKNYAAEVVDEIFSLDTADALNVQRDLLTTEGIFPGVSAAAILWTATRLAEREENEGKMIVAIFPDSGERYLSAAIKN
ncbi:PLP-dependent cysteine synthase family protein [Bartonella apis]|uniref:PLP-dependent cysteine synthase family protein n=1 Tax=Bartonella apis TaxID=1686310 RepID=UPI00242B86CD|nr:cysteine synthase family protein [Bartonella apis]MCT6861146.1 cysteine synthase family protein [Bartonella apis]